MEQDGKYTLSISIFSYSLKKMFWYSISSLNFETNQQHFHVNKTCSNWIMLEYFFISETIWSRLWLRHSSILFCVEILFPHSNMMFHCFNTSKGIYPFYHWWKFRLIPVWITTDSASVKLTINLFLWSHVYISVECVTIDLCVCVIEFSFRRKCKEGKIFPLPS